MAVPLSELAGEDVFDGIDEEEKDVYAGVSARRLRIRDDAGSQMYRRASAPRQRASQLLGRWVQAERDGMGRDRIPLDVSERAELERLRTENSELRLDNEFLEAAAFFAARSPAGVFRGDLDAERRTTRSAGCAGY